MSWVSYRRWVWDYGLPSYILKGLGDRLLSMHTLGFCVPKMKLDHALLTRYTCVCSSGFHD